MICNRGYFLGCLMILLSCGSLNAAEEKKTGFPPSLVNVSTVVSGTLSPEVEFTGTVFYSEVSDVASEVKGKIIGVLFDEGKSVKNGQILARIDAELLEKEMEALRASYEQMQVEKEKADVDLKRSDELFKDGVVSVESRDDLGFKVRSLDRNLAVIKARMENMEAEYRRKTIYTPFEGIVVKRHAEVGEWLEPGRPVATIAKTSEVDIVVNVPEKTARSLKTGNDVSIRVNGRNVKGKVFAVMPAGDVATRTFPVKIRIKNTLALREGMEAAVTLPSGESRKAFIISRDALISKFGKMVVFIVENATARMIPVSIAGFQGKKAGVVSDGLSDGMDIVIKGNERIMDGQAVVISGKGK